jgi:hypothetical protein
VTEQKDILEIKAFSDTITVEGFTYYDSHSRLFNILRMPAVMKYLFPHMKKKKLKFEIRCFPNNQKLKEYIDSTQNVPLVLNLFEREEEPINLSQLPNR